MKNTYITIAVVLVILLAIFAVLKSKKLEAPSGMDDMAGMQETDTTNSVTPSTDANNMTPKSNDTSSTSVTGSVDLSLGTTVVKEFTVTGKNFSFDPSTINVKKGDKVKITFVNSEGFHNFIIDQFSLVSKTTKSPTTETLEFTADKTGSFEYYCSVGTHRAMGMKGTLIVS